MKLTTATDIQRECIVESGAGYGFARRTRIICDHNTRNVEAFGTIQPAKWKWTRYAVAPDTSYGEFSHTPTYAKAVELMRYGWPAGTAEANKYVVKLMPKLPHAQRIKKVYRPSVAPIGGINLNVPSVVQGSPDMFIGHIPTRQKTRGSKIVRIGVNQSASGCTGGAKLIHRGAAILAMMQTLQRMGFSPDITVFDAFETGWGSSRYAYLSEWHVMPAGAKPNPDVIAFAMAHPSCLRRIMFAMLEHAPDPSQLHGGYGMVSAMRATFPDVCKGFDIIVDSLSGDNPVWNNEQSVVDWVHRQLAEQGIMAEDATFSKR